MVDALRGLLPVIVTLWRNIEAAAITVIQACPANLYTHPVSDILSVACLRAYPPNNACVTPASVG